MFSVVYEMKLFLLVSDVIVPSAVDVDMYIQSIIFVDFLTETLLCMSVGLFGP